ncbi:MAG TPA: pyruvate kinase [Patescibacteria group bacterium]|nr:pyruvate kinase [Patescibacteria group bacterium]
MKKLTKIIATVGPSSESEENIGKLIDLGVNIFRFNIKHNELSWHKEKVELVKKVAAKKGVAIGTLLDLQGPEIRTVVPGEEVVMKTGDKVIVGKGEGYPNFTISHPSVIKHLTKGQKVVVEDGRAQFTVTEVLKDGAVLKAEQDQTLKTKKTFNLPGANYPMPTLTEKDEEAIKMAAKSQVDFLALSFVRTAKDILDLKDMMKKCKLVARVIPKIETRLALENLDDIVANSEGLMVARGDLGIEIPIEQVPFYQKLMIKKCNERGIPVITATQMLLSMAANPYPTRAEVSDIANAAYDFTDAVMLSEESAMGKFPLETVKMMADTVSFSEKQNLLKDTRDVFDYYILDSEEMLCDTAYSLYLQFERQEQPIGGFIIFSETGRTGRKLSRYRPKAPIYVFTPNEKVRDGLSMSFGVTPFVQPGKTKEKNQVRIEDMKEAFGYLVKHEKVDPDKRYILLYGDNWNVAGGISTIKVVFPKNLD